MRKGITYGAVKRPLAVLTAAALLGAGFMIPAPQAEAAVKPVKLTVTPASKTLYVGKYSPYKTTKLKVKITPSKAKKKVKYKSLSKKVATVNSKGKVTAKKKGTAKIKVTTVAKNKKGKNLSKTIKIKVKKYVAPAGITASISADKLQAGQTAQIKASLSGKPTCKTIVYTSSDSKVATVNSKGLVTAVAAGNATITVKSKVKGNKGKVLQKTFAVTVTGNSQGSGGTNTPAPTAGTSASPDVTPSSEPTAEPTPTQKPTPRPKPTATPLPTPTPEVGAEAELTPVSISNLPSLEDAAADAVKPADMTLNKKNEYSMADSNDGMTISLTMTINKLNSSGNTFLWNTSGAKSDGTGDYPMAFQAVTPSGQLYTELDWRSQFYTTDNFIPIGKEFTLVTTYTDKEIRIYLDGELKAYYNAETGYSIGGSFTQGALCPANTTAYLATVRGSWKQYLLGVAPTCINQGKTVTSGTVKDFAIYKKPLQPKPQSTAEQLIYPETATYEISPDKDMVDFGATLLNATADTKVTYTSSDTSVAGFTKEGKLRLIKGGQVDIKAKTSGGVEATCKVTVNYSTIALHDPSVFQDPISGYYYTVASHCLAGYSKDMKSWALVSNSGDGYGANNKLFTKQYQQEFKEVYDYVKPNNANPEGVWAPSIIYSEEMVKYYMYVTIADGTAQGKCAIVLTSADKPEGPYKYEKMIVASAMTKEDVEKTNLMDVLNIKDKSQIPEKYYATSDKTYPDCIDATVFYDHTGKLWMTYGSFTCGGGIRMIQLDPVTGDRLESATYEDNGTAKALGDKDPYYGIKLANTNGEGPFIMEVPSKKSSTGYYYFLWNSVGHLQSNGGYHMRMYRSENVEGPYVDTAGQKATSSLGKAQLGLRVMDNYKFSFMDFAFTSCGGNSAVLCADRETTEDGKMFLHYHQKWANGTENFVTKSNQMFLNEDGWLVTAPFAYDGESMDKTYTKEEVAGDYEFVLHRTSYAQTGAYDYSNSVVVKLNADETISGGYTGTWTLKDNYITIKIGEETYKGVVLEQTMEDKDRTKAMVFTGVGDGNIQSVWGAKMVLGDEYYLGYDLNQISIPSKTDKDFEVPLKGFSGSDITWQSSNTQAIQLDGNTAKVKRLDETAKVTLTATAKQGEKTKTKVFEVVVPAFEIVLPTIITADTTLALPENSVQGSAITWQSSDSSVIDISTGKVTTRPNEVVEVTLTATYGTVTTTFTIRVGELKLKTIYGQDYEAANLDIAGAGWIKNGALTGEILADSGNKYAKFTSTGTGARSGLQTFGIASDSLTSTYTVSTDFAVKTASYSGSGQPTTQIALVSQSNTIKGDGIVTTDSECIVDLRATGMSSKDFVINGTEESVTVPAGAWCHMEATVNQTEKQVFLLITDSEGNELYSGTHAISGDTKIKGIFILNGRGGTITQFDNTTVKVTE